MNEEMRIEIELKAVERIVERIHNGCCNRRHHCHHCREEERIVKTEKYSYSSYIPLIKLFEV